MLTKFLLPTTVQSLPILVHPTIVHLVAHFVVWHSLILSVPITLISVDIR